ncbi:MAG: hypothetical protein JWP44_5099 [Mucilaginibacter sp.]|nr:hypothetical protein [Mucilaginibacter sp.]
MLSFLPLIIEAIIKLFSSSSAGTVATVAEGVVGAAAEPFLNPAKMALRIGMIVAIVAAIGGAWWYVDHLKSEVSVAQSQVAALTSANAQQKQALDLCTANTEDLKKASDALAKQAAEAQAKAEVEAKPHYDKAKDIMNTKPIAGQSDIEAINALLNSLIPVRIQP